MQLAPHFQSIVCVICWDKFCFSLTHTPRAAFIASLSWCVCLRMYMHADMYKSHPGCTTATREAFKAVAATMNRETQICIRKGRRVVNHQESRSWWLRKWAMLNWRKMQFPVTDKFDTKYVCTSHSWKRTDIFDLNLHNYIAKSSKNRFFINN
jgi:hypothetical protein